jgi:hypothetical protein
MKGFAAASVFAYGRSTSLRNVGNYSPNYMGSLTGDINLCSKIPQIPDGVQLQAILCYHTIGNMADLTCSEALKE